MPHLPRKYAATLNVPPSEAQPEVTQARPANPEVEAGSSKPKLGLKRISLQSYHVDPADIARILFGKDARIDGNTGQLVLGPGR